LSRLLFLNLPVADLQASRAFFEGLGFEFDRRLSGEGAGCMVVGGQAYVMLLRRDCFARFVTRPVANPALSTALTVAVTAESRAEVDALADAALAAGAAPGKGPQEFGFMYQRSFHDLDGHLWEILWMDQPGSEES